MEFQENLHHQQRERGRRRNHSTPHPRTSLNITLLRTTIIPGTLWRRPGRRNDIARAIRIICVITVVQTAVVGIIRRVPVPESAHGSDGGEEPRDDEAEPEKEIAADVCAGVYGA